MTNYAKLGEYTAHKKQAQDAADRRRISLSILERESERLRGSLSKAVDEEELLSVIKDAVSADKEMRAALAVANQAAPLCGEQEIELKFLMSL